MPVPLKQSEVSMNQQPVISMSDGVFVLQIGLGVHQTPSHETAQVVATALQAGYRYVDTAAI
jgi:diketogulonate reductase-like aldo/keto reductase